MVYQYTSRQQDLKRKRQKKAREYINQAKILIGKCQICDLPVDSKRFHEFHFDHIDPSTKLSRIGSMTSYSLQVIKNEIDKCQLLCYICHMKRTQEEGHRSIRPGNDTATQNTDQLSFDL